MGLSGLKLNQQYLYFVCSIISISSLLLNITNQLKDLHQGYLCPGGRFSLEDCLFDDITPTLIVCRGVIPPGLAGGSFVPDRLDPPATRGKATVRLNSQHTNTVNGIDRIRCPGPVLKHYIVNRIKSLAWVYF